MIGTLSVNGDSGGWHADDVAYASSDWQAFDTFSFMVKDLNFYQLRNWFNINDECFADISEGFTGLYTNDN